MMSNEDIIAIIKWGPLALFLIIFLIGMLRGLIKGRRKALRRTIYTVLFIVLMFLFTPKICEFLLGLEINGVGVQAYIDDFIENNETIQDMCNQIPGLNRLLEIYPNAIISLILFVVLVLVGLPLSFPIYWIYCIIYNLINKHVFKYSKYERDANGKVLRNEKGKKIKKKVDKHRLTGGLLKGVEGVLVTSVIFVPVGVVTRLYNDAKDSSESGDLSNIEYLANAKDILTYIDAFNDSFIGKVTNSKVNQSVAGYLSPVEIEGDKSTLEKELSDVVVAAVYLEESGLIKLLSGDINILTLDLSKLNIDKIDKAIEMVFKSTTLKSIVSDGVNYVLNNYLQETLVDFTNDGNIMNKIKYNNADEVKAELLRVTDVIRTIINAKLLEDYQDNHTNLVGVVNQINASDVELILNKVLSIKILSECMPGAMTKILQDYGLVSSLTKDNNNDFVKVLVNVIKLVQTLELENLEQVTEGNMLDNIVNVLYKEGAIKSNSMDALATLLSDINSSRVFDEVLVTQLNKILDQYEIKLNAQMIANVETKEDWQKELLVIENICEMYDMYNKDGKVDFLTATELLTNVKNSKAMILALPIAYQKLFPQLGIEIDLNKIEYVDYSEPDAYETEAKFYSYWKDQVVHLENISDEMARLEISSISDISLDLLDIEANVESLSNIIAEVFSSDLLKDGVSKLINDTMKDLLLEYEVNLNDNAISNVNNLVNTTPYYITDNTTQYEIKLVDDKYYIGATEVNIVDGKVIYDGDEYDVKNNTLNRIWKKELMNLSNVVKVVKTGEYTSKDNLTIILDSVDTMELLKDVKNDLLLYAVKQVGILDDDYYNNIDRSVVSFSKEKTILLNVIDDYETLKDMSNIDFATITDDEITTLSSILTNVLSSDIFGNYAADTIVDLAKGENITLTVESVKSSTTWESDLKLVRTALNMNKDSFDETTVTQLLTGIKQSSLLGPVKEQLLLDTAKKISMEGISISETLEASDIDYDTESAAIISAARNLSLVESLSEIVIGEVDTDAISDLLASTINSKLFGDSVVEKLVLTLTGEDIKHDYDTDSTNNSYLIETIKSIDTQAKWENEFDTIKTLLEVDTREEVTIDLFNSLEKQTVLLSACRANLLIKMVDEIKLNDTTLDLSDVSVETLVGVDKKYTQYGYERDFLIELTNLTNINDISDITSGNKEDVADALDAMKMSVIFDKEYDSLLADMTKPIKDIDVGEEKTLSDWGIVVDESPEVESWSVEIDSLLIINDNMGLIAKYDLDDAKANTATIGNTLDALDNSSIVSGTDKVAGKLVDSILGVEGTVVTKDSDKTWKQTFDAILGNN